MKAKIFLSCGTKCGFFYTKLNVEVNKFMKIYLILKDHKFVFYSNNQKSKKNSKSDA